MLINDKKLGYVIIAFLLVFIVCICAVFTWVVYIQPRQFTIKFDKVGNLKIEDAVVHKGFSIGHVKSMQWSASHVLVTVETNKRPLMYADYRIEDVEKGVMGDRIIMMDCGGLAGRPLSLNDTLQGTFIPGISEGIAYAGRLHAVIRELDSIASILRCGKQNQRSLIEVITGLVDSSDAVLSRLSAGIKPIARDAGSFLDSTGHLLANASASARPVIRKTPSILKGMKTGSDSLVALTGHLQAILDSVQAKYADLNGADTSRKTQKTDALYRQLSDIQEVLDFISSSGLLLRVGINFH
jgi:ABC-type transporter Mla subunit MlaD